MKSDQRRMKHVWMVEDAPSSSVNSPPKSFWTKIGIAFENEDGSLTLQLAAIPVTGKMVVRDATPFASTLKTRGAA